MKKLSQKAKFQLEINSLQTALKLAQERIADLSHAIALKDRDHNTALAEARRRTIPLKDMGWDVNFLPEYVISVESKMEPVGFSSKFSPHLREYVSGPAEATIRVFGAVIVNQLTPSVPATPATNDTPGSNLPARDPRVLERIG